MNNRQPISFVDFLKPTYLRIFLFGICSGLPWVAIGSVLTLWLKDAGLSRTEIGFAGMIFAVYSVNFLWAPAIDQLKLPILYQLGKRKSWLLLTQALLALFCISVSFTNPSTEANLTVFFCLLIAIASASQDMVIDAYRIECKNEHISDEKHLAIGSSMTTAGWWTGYAGLGAVPLFLYDSNLIDWSGAYWIIAAFFVLSILCVLFSPEPYTLLSENNTAPANHVKPTNLLSGFLRHLHQAVIAPISSFITKQGLSIAIKILLFILLFKVGEAFLGRMSLLFYKEVGFDEGQIATYSKLVSWFVTIAFAIISGMFSAKFGLFKGLFISGLAMAASNMLFALIAVVGPSEPLFAITVITDGFTSAWSSVAFVAFISSLTEKRFTATQYALFASLSTLSRTLLASYSGALVDWLQSDWALFFILTTLAVIPALALLTSIRKTEKIG